MALLTQLDARLPAGEGLTPRTRRVVRAGGAGKTSVVVESMPTVTWLRSRWRGSSPPTTARCWRPGFAELAAQLGAPGLADTRDPVASVHAVLAGFATPWLLLFDNAAYIASVAVFLPPAEPGRLLRAPTQQNGRSGAARLACQPAGTRRQIGGYSCVLLTSPVAQRDAGIGRWTLRAAASSCALAAWAVAALRRGVPGHGRPPGPARWMTRGWCPSPNPDPDRGHRRHPDRPGRDSRRSPSAS